VLGISAEWGPVSPISLCLVNVDVLQTWLKYQTSTDLSIILTLSMVFSTSSTTRAHF
jgi:hypothetical protein